MIVLVDTSIWTLALRRAPRQLQSRQRELLEAWKDLVKSGAACLIGPIRQEILSGIRDPGAYSELRKWLDFFDLIEIIRDDYDRAAALFNTLAERGIVGSPIDLLICAVSQRIDAAIFTTDSDFLTIARHVPLQFHAA